MPFIKGYVPWNKGLTKEDDERILQHSQKLIGNTFGTVNKGKINKHKRSEEEIKRLASLRKGVPSPMKGKTLEEVYGPERAAELKKKNSESKIGHIAWNKGKSNEELYGKEKAAELRLKNSKSHTGVRSKLLGKTFEDIYGIEKARSLKEHQSRIQKGKPNGRKGQPSGRKGESKYPPLDFGQIKFCKCGCGEQIKIIKSHRYNGVADYISGHQVHKQLPVFKDTGIEVKLQNILKENNIAFTTHKGITGFPDIFIEPNICIFADGDYWHATPRKYLPDKVLFSNKTAKEIRDKDAKITQTLLADGYRVLRFWEHDINNNVEDCFTKIKEVYINEQ